MVNKENLFKGLRIFFFHRTDFPGKWFICSKISLKSSKKALRFSVWAFVRPLEADFQEGVKISVFCDCEALGAL